MNQCGQSSYVTTFADKLVGSGALSEAKIKEYALSLQEEEDLINSALLFATTSDPGRYEAKMKAAQNKVAEWTAPLQNIKYYGMYEDILASIDNRSKFVADMVNKLKSKEYEQALDRISNDGIIDKKTKALIDNYTKDTDIKDAIAYLD